MPKVKKGAGHITVTLPEYMVEYLTIEAKNNDMSRSQLVRSMVRQRQEEQKVTRVKEYNKTWQSK